MSYINKNSEDCSVGGVSRIATVDDMLGLVAFISRRSPPVVGFSVAYDFESPPILIDARKNAYVSDLPSVRPQSLALVVVEPSQNGCRYYKYLIDLQNEEVLSGIQQIFSMPINFVGFDLKMSLFCMWKLGLVEPGQIWDCYTFEKAQSLGRYNYRYFLTEKTDWIEEAKARDRAEAKKDYDLSIEVVCQKYGVGLSCFMDDDPTHCNSEQAIAVASAAVELYEYQTRVDVDEDLIKHCESVEMPWVVTNASMEWRGVRVDYDKATAIVDKITPVANALRKILLDDYGIENPHSTNDLAAFFRREKLLDRFQNNGHPSFGKEKLKAKRNLHPAIPVILRTRKLLDIISNKIHRPELSGIDGRVHPNHRQLGADTGRQTCTLPNVAGLSRFLKPMIIPADGYGIGEVDYSQIEPGIAGVFYADTKLVEMYNSNDVYAAMVKIFFRSRLSDADVAMGYKRFKTEFSDLREQMKTCTLGMIYGMTPHGIADDLGITYAEAQSLQRSFAEMFPDLATALKRQRVSRSYRRSVYIMNSLMRHKGDKRLQGQFALWEENWFANTPIQGSGAIIFKAAGNQLYQLYKPYGARLIIPVHDSFVFEAPLDQLEEVAELTARVMRETLKHYFPDLNPRVDINISHPECWNKDGCLGFEIHADGSLVEVWG